MNPVFFAGGIIKFMNWEIREINQEFREGENNMPLKTRLMIAGGLIGGIAIGTLLFLFFLTIFIYVFIPVTAILIISSLVQRFFKRQ